MAIEISLYAGLKNFDLDINIRSVARRIGILGPSGSGKSMTLKMIAGIISPEKGLVEIDGERLFDSQHRIDIRPQKRRVGYLFQNYALFPSMTVEKNIRAGIRKSVSEKEKQEIVSEMIGRLGLKGLEENYPAQLSGGQQQRVALARILANAPDVILLDEPFSALDVHLRDRMMRQLMDTLEDFPGIVIMVSHSRDEIYRFSEEIIVIDQGRVIDQGEKKQLFASPSCVRSAMLTGCKNYSRARKTGDHEFFASDWGVHVKTGRSVPDGLTCIGCRAHDFLPLWGNEGSSAAGCIPFKLERIDELPFEINCYLNPTGLYDHPYRTCLWIMQRSDRELIREKGLPDWLQMKSKDILFFDR